MTQVISRFHPVDLMDVEQRQVAADPQTKPTDLGSVSPPVGCYYLHPPSPFIITQPEIWYSFYRSTEGRRLSQPRNTGCYY